MLEVVDHIEVDESPTFRTLLVDPDTRNSHEEGQLKDHVSIGPIGSDVDSPECMRSARTRLETLGVVFGAPIAGVDPHWPCIGYADLFQFIHQLIVDDDLSTVFTLELVGSEMRPPPTIDCILSPQNHTTSLCQNIAVAGPRLYLTSSVMKPGLYTSEKQSRS